MKKLQLDYISKKLLELTSTSYNIWDSAMELEDLIGEHEIDSSNSLLVEAIEDFGYDLAFFQPDPAKRDDPSLYDSEELVMRATMLRAEIHKEIG